MELKHLATVEECIWTMEWFPSILGTCHVSIIY